MASLIDLVDGNWVDICSLTLAVIYALIRWAGNRRDRHQRLISRATGLDIANGVSLFPLMLLIAASFSSHALSAILSSNKLILSVAGVVALLAILDTGSPQREMRNRFH